MVILRFPQSLFMLAAFGQIEVVFGTMSKILISVKYPDLLEVILISFALTMRKLEAFVTFLVV